MAIIRPCADLRNKYNEISRLCHETNNPVYITKNGYNDLVLLSSEAYEKYEEARIEKIVSNCFDKKYSDFESFKKDIYEKINQGLTDIKNGDYHSTTKAFEKIEEKYNINDLV